MRVTGGWDGTGSYGAFLRQQRINRSRSQCRGSRCEADPDTWNGSSHVCPVCSKRVQTNSSGTIFVHQPT